MRLHWNGVLHGVLSIVGLPAAAIVMLPGKDYVISLVLSHLIAKDVLCFIVCTFLCKSYLKTDVFLLFHFQQVASSLPC